MLVNKTQPTEEEIAAQQAEARKATAEGEFVIICEDKKRVLNETELLKKELENTESKIESNKVDIQTTEDILFILKQQVSDLNSEINEIIKEKTVYFDELEQFKKEADSKKVQIANEINSLLITYKNQQDENSKEIEKLNSEKELILNNLNTTKEVISILDTEKTSKESIIANLNTEIDSLNSKFKILGSSIEIKDKELQDKDIFIESKNTIIEKLEKEIKEKEVELSSFDIKISKKEEEYKAIETKAFVILNKQQALDSKEAFIKSQYERAGIKWE
jgi:chromosome segregation ATPase